MTFYHLQIFFKSSFLEKFVQEYHNSQTVWIQIRPDILSGLVWIKTVCKDHQQTTLAGKEFNSLHNGIYFLIFSPANSEINFFRKFFQEYHQSVKQLRSRSVTDSLSCKDHQQMTLAGKELTSYIKEMQKHNWPSINSSKQHCMLGNFAGFFVVRFFHNLFSKKLIKQIWSRSGWTIFQAWSGSKLFPKVIGGQQSGHD